MSNLKRIDFGGSELAGSIPDKGWENLTELTFL
jgi:hypothetical protein